MSIMYAVRCDYCNNTVTIDQIGHKIDTWYRLIGQANTDHLDFCSMGCLVQYGSYQLTKTYAPMTYKTDVEIGHRRRIKINWNCGNCGATVCTGFMDENPQIPETCPNCHALQQQNEREE